MQLIIDVPDRELMQKVIELLKPLKKAGIKVRGEEKNFSKLSEKGKKIDCSRYKIKSFQNIDGMSYQRKVRDEW